MDIKYDVAKPFQRTNSFPLDISSLFTSYEDAVKYAKCGKTKVIGDSRRLGKTAYQGQIISVIDNASVEVYKIDFDWTLKHIGNGGGGDDGKIKTDIVDEDGNVIVEEGTPVTDALQTVLSFLEEKMSKSGKVKDVQINETSILSEDGVANINFSHDNSIDIDISQNDVDISFKGIFNEEITL